MLNKEQKKKTSQSPWCRVSGSKDPGYQSPRVRGLRVQGSQVSGSRVPGVTSWF